MRFIALTLTVLLAGSQARFLQDEPPSQLEHVNTALQVYADQLKQSAHTALNHIDDTEFKDYKEFLGQSVDNIHGYFQHAFKSMGTYATPVMEAIAPVREKLKNDVEDLCKQIEPKREELRQVLVKHFQEYSTELKPLVEEYLTKHREQMEELKTKLEPVVKNMKGKIATNWEETKSKLVPILEAVRDKVTEHLQGLKTQLEPYIQDYKEQMEKSTLEFRESVRSGELRKKMNALGDDVKPHLEAIAAAIQKAFNKE
ncbi:apolipoprotein A-Ib isoform X2 [Triplophysa rosa]|uniref:Apolipoprotein A-I-1 n=1 Tax=Triplophysa rosa TaxID=992332 RepID=A0A9W7TR75_TRIRA|nr:apolipoprotein A-Ib isoform X2 [Triplophysa rosa]KAI7800692.1 apolipoprotein A-I-1 [Triplophysa rosa]